MRLGILFSAALLAPCSLSAQSNWVESARVDELRQELGAAAPDGSGVSIVQSEATGFEGSSAFYPQPGSGAFAGQNLGSTGGISRDYRGVNFSAQSGERETSQHAQQVARRLYERTEGIAPGVNQVSLYTSGDYGNWTGSINPRPEGRVHNSSWIGSGSVQGRINDADSAALNRNFLHCIGLDNGIGSIPGLYGHAYNTIAVGRRDGSHSWGKTSTSFAGPGRMKPDLVGFSAATSFSTPEVSGVAALLYQTVDENPALSAANNANVMRAILLAGADKDFSAAWAREQSDEPYDPVFGAGLLDAFESYQILLGGEGTPSNSSLQNRYGWASVNSIEQREFLFQVPEGNFGDQFSVALSWFRAQDGRDDERTAIDLILQKQNPAGEWVDFERSDSAVDNVEHLFHRHLLPGNYRLVVPEVSFEEGLIFTNEAGFDYALAWRLSLGTGPALHLAGDSLLGSNLDPRIDYTIESSITLGEDSWQPVGSLPAAERYEADTGITIATTEPFAFYRLAWSEPSALP